MCSDVLTTPCRTHILLSLAYASEPLSRGREQFAVQCGHRAIQRSHCARATLIRIGERSRRIAIWGRLPPGPQFHTTFANSQDPCSSTPQSKMHMDLNPELYPRSYEMGSEDRSTSLFLGWGLIGAPAWLAIALVVAGIDDPATIGITTIGAIGLLIVGIHAVSGTRRKIVLTTDSITLTGGLESPRTMLRSQIKEVRPVMAGTRYRYVRLWTLVPNAPGIRPLKIDRCFDTDNEFDVWMAFPGYDPDPE